MYVYMMNEKITSIVHRIKRFGLFVHLFKWKATCLQFMFSTRIKSFTIL